MTRCSVRITCAILSLMLIAVSLSWQPTPAPAPVPTAAPLTRTGSARGGRPVDVLRVGQPVATATVMPAAIPTLEPISLGVFTITGYTNHDAGMNGRGITRSGEPARWGIVAVDPRIIPLGAKVGIEGMGAFEAADTGGGVRGRHIDVWYPSRGEALAHGVQEREVWRVER